MEAFEIKGIIADFLFIWRLFKEYKRKTDRIHTAAIVFIALATEGIFRHLYPLL
jgi:hypothetical protein